MAQQSSFYFTDGATRTFPSTKHIASTQHVAVYFKSVATNTWSVIEQSMYDVVNQSVVFTTAPDNVLYSELEVRVADTATELTQSPSDIALVAGSIANVNTVATSISNVNTVATNIATVNTVSGSIANVNTVAGSIANVNSVASNATNVNTVAGSIANVNSVATTVVPNIVEILAADDNAATATAQAGIATTQAGIATTQAGLSTTSATNSQLRAWEAEAERLTADSYATEAEDVVVKVYSSNGNGTFTATPTTEYSALHWRNKAVLAASGQAVNITYDNTASGLAATNVQMAVDEIVTEKAPTASPAFTGTPTAPTATAGTYTTQVATMEAVNSSIVKATAYTFTGTETFKDFTGIPSWAKRITITLDNFSTSGSSNVLFQIGDAGGIENSGYAGSVAHLVHATTPTVINFSTGFLLDSASDTSNIRSGASYLSLLTGNQWLFSSVCGRNSVAIEAAGGSKTLSATLDRLRITTAGGTDTIDAGSIVNISWEG